MQRQQIIVVTDISCSYGRGVLVGVGRFATKLGCWSLRSIPTWGMNDDVLNPPTRGLIVQAMGLAMSRKVAAGGLPAVNVADNDLDHPLPTIMSDNRLIGQLAGEHFLSRGYVNLGYCGLANAYYARQRHLGFTATARAAGRSVREYWFPDHPQHLWYGPLREWLDSLPRPIAVMACNDAWAREVGQACFDLDLHIPEDVAIIGVDNDQLISEIYDVPLSTIAIAAERIGYEAASLLCRLLAGERAPDGPIIIPPVGVVERQSTDILAVTDRLVSQAIRFIHEHIAEPITVADLVSHLATSRRSLEKHFLKVLKCTPAAEMRRCRVERAKHLLTTTDVAMSTIAFDCGFTDSPRLTKVFRQCTGMTPSTYRMRTRLR
jgi:LacI family transcriptional regulator